VLPRVLIVDDNAPVREVLAEFLAIRDYRVTPVGTADEALRACREGGMDVVVLDLALGEADGFQVLEALKIAFPELPVIVMTGMRPLEEWRTEAFQRGAGGFVSKEESTEQLLLEIRRVLRLEAEKRRRRSSEPS
jgi:DNA-binding NtrC family response regulator